jgi:hypothetical protein
MPDAFKSEETLKQEKKEKEKKEKKGFWKKTGAFFKDTFSSSAKKKDKK